MKIILVRTETKLIKYLLTPFRSFVKDCVHSYQNVLDDHVTNKLVFYPGCATDIIRCILITKAVNLVGVDMVDPTFYPGLDESETPSNHTRNVAELTSIMQRMTKDLLLIETAIPDSVERTKNDKLFGSMDITGNKLTCSFKLFKVRRNVTVYVGKDANSFVPQELKDARINVMFHSAYTSDMETILKYQPKYVIVPEGELEYSLTPTTRKFKKTWHWSGDYDFTGDSMAQILDKKTQSDPLVLAKAHIIKEVCNSTRFEVIQL